MLHRFQVQSTESTLRSGSGRVRASRPIRSTGTPQALADHVFTTFEGAFILARATDEPAHVRSQLGQLRRYLELLLESGV